MSIQSAVDLNSFLVISFDLDDTLWDNAQIVHYSERLLVDKLTRDFPDIQNIWTERSLRKLKEALFHQHGLARGMTFLRSEWLSEILTKAGYSAEQEVGELMNYFLTHRSQVRLFAGVKECLTALRSRFRVYALTNGNVDLKIAGVESYFDGLINPDKIQRAKPDPDFYRLAQREIAVEPHRILHIGDGWKNDVLASVEAGFRAAWFNPTNEPPPDPNLLSFHFQNWQQMHTLFSQNNGD